MADMNYRTSYESPLPVKQVRHYLINAKTPAEKKIWRDMLNGPEYHKFKDGAKLVTKGKKKEEPAPEPAKGKKKK